MIPKHIIEKAIEGGWKDTRPQISAVEREEDVPKATIVNDFMNFYSTPVVVCEPLFWQALGKALGWDNRIDDLYTLIADVDVKWMTIAPDTSLPAQVERHVEENRMKYRISQAIKDIENRGWKYYAQCFFDLLLTGGDTEKFWQELVDKK